MVGLRIGAILVAGLTILVDAAWAESPNEKPGGRTDRYGDPLPDTAIARLGTVRYRHAGGTVFIAFPPDAKKVISVGTDGTLRQWDLTTGKELRRFSIGGSNDVVDDLRRVINRGRCHELYSESKLALSPDASTLAVDCQDHVRLYELRTGKETQTVGLQETSSEAMALSSKGKTLAILDDRGSIQLYDLVTGHKRGQFANSAKGDYGIRGRLQFSPDGQTLVSVEESPGKTTMTIWDMIARKQLASIASQTKLQAFSKLTFSPDCRHLAWIDRKGMIILADAVSGKELRRFGKSCIFEDFAFAPDNRTLVARVCFGDDIVVLDIATGNNIRQFRVTRPFLPRSSSAMAFSADGHFLAMGSKDALISIIDFFKGKEINPADEHRNSVVHVNYGRDGRWIFSWDRDRQARVWDIETGKELRRFLLPDGALNAVYSNDCRLLAFTCIDHFGICVQDVDSKKKHRQLSRNFGLFTSLKFSPDNKRLVVVGPQQSVPTTRSEKWEIGLYDVTTGTKVRDFVVSASARNKEREELGWLALGRTVISFSSDSRVLAVSCARDKLVLWDTVAGAELSNIEVVNPGMIRAVAFSPDGRSMAIDAGDGVLSLWETATGKLRRRYEWRDDDNVLPGDSLDRLNMMNQADCSSTNLGLAISPDCRLVAHGRPCGSIAFWNMATGEPAGELTGHQADVTALAFAPDGRKLASGSKDTTILVWDLKSVRAKLKPPAEKPNLEAAWNNLQSKDAALAFGTMCALTSVPAEAVPLLKDHLHGSASLDVQKVQRLIADLDSEQSAVRKQASAQLEKLGQLAGPALRKALEGDVSPEVRRRIESLLAKVANISPDGELLGRMRAIEVLERISTAQAKEVLQGVVKDVSDPILMRAAQAALDRLEKRTGE